MSPPPLARHSGLDGRLMNFNHAIVEPHDLTCARLAAFCQYVGLAVAEDTIGNMRLSGIVGVVQENNDGPLDHLRCRMGVYAFQLGGCVIYVGKCRKATSEWNLSKRIPQHYHPTDTGGTLRVNWFRQHGCDFAAFQEKIAECRLWTISFPQREDTQKVARLEHLLIGVLGPRYCDVPAL